MCISLCVLLSYRLPKFPSGLIKYLSVYLSLPLFPTNIHFSMQHSEQRSNNTVAVCESINTSTLIWGMDILDSGFLSSIFRSKSFTSSDISALSGHETQTKTQCSPGSLQLQSQHKKTMKAWTHKIQCVASVNVCKYVATRGRPTPDIFDSGY